MQELKLQPKSKQILLRGLEQIDILSYPHLEKSVGLEVGSLWFSVDVVWIWVLDLSDAECAVVSLGLAEGVCRD